MSTRPRIKFTQAQLVPCRAKKGLRNLSRLTCQPVWLYWNICEMLNLHFWSLELPRLSPPPGWNRRALRQWSPECEPWKYCFIFVALFTVSVWKWFNEWTFALLQMTSKLDNVYVMTWSLIIRVGNMMPSHVGVLPNLHEQYKWGAEILCISEMCMIHIIPDTRSRQHVVLPSTTEVSLSFLNLGWCELGREKPRGKELMSMR